MANPVMHWQILTKQPKKLEEFYSALFGWRQRAGLPAGGYRLERRDPWRVLANRGKGGAQHGAALHPGG
jgi:predicted enzyme related to lactoylglutathione lyase